MSIAKIQELDEKIKRATEYLNDIDNEFTYKSAMADLSALKKERDELAAFMDMPNVHANVRWDMVIGKTKVG